MNDVTQTLKDAAYITVGAGVIAFQKAQVQRQEIQKRLAGLDLDPKHGFERVSGTLEDRVKLVEERFEGLQGQLETAVATLEGNVDRYLDQLQGRLPEQAGEYVAQARSAAKDAQAQLRQLVGA
jgi:anion-transporting  ArsA/GET3 family ATPase